MSTKKKILVTGATGFIGTNLIPLLLNAGYSVIASSRNMEKAKLHSWYNSVTYISFDLNEPWAILNLYEYFRKPDVVIHLAWYGLPNYNSLHHIEKNLMMHYFFCKNLIENGLKNISVTGTCMEYGMQNGCLNEDCPTLPANAYSISKAALYDFISLLQLEFSFNFKWLRLFYSYGKGQHANSLYSQLVTAISQKKQEFNMSMGDQIRDFLPIETMVYYIFRASIQDKINGIINISSNEPVTVISLVEKIIRENNSMININRGYYPYSNLEPKHFWGDNSKLLNILSNE